MDLGTLWGAIGLDDSPFAQGLQSALGKLAEFGPKAVKVAAVAGGAVALAFVGSVVAGMSVEAANDRLAAQLGLTEAESERIGGVAGALYADAYGESLEQVNDAVGAVMTSIKGMSNASDAELSDATTKVLDFAKAFEVDVTRAAQIAGQMIQTGLAADSTEAFDLLVAASQRVPAALREDLLDAVDEYGQFFASLGYSGEEAFAVLVEGSEKGMYGIDKAGDSIKEFTIRATDMSALSKEAYKTIGLDAEEMSNKILAGGDTAADATQQIIDGLLGIKDPATQANTAIALFGTPIEDLNTGEIPDFLKSLSSGSDAMDGFGGSADRMGDTLNGNASTSLTEIKRRAEAAFLWLGNWALPIVNDVTAAVADNLAPGIDLLGFALTALFLAAEATFGFIGEHQLIFSIIAGTITVLLLPALAALVIQAAIAAASTVASWIAMSAGAAVSAAAQIASLTLLGLQWIFAGGQALLSAAKVAAAWLIAMGPIGLVIAAVIAVVILIVKNWDKIKAATAAAWSWVVSNVVGAWNRVSGAVSRGVSSVVSFVRGLPGKIKGALSGAGTWLLEAGKDVMRGLRDGIEAGFDWVKGKLSGVGRLIPGWLKKVLGISSPSKVMRDEVGYWIPAGVADGIDAGSGLLQSAVDDMAASVVVPISAAPSLRAAGAAWAAAEGGPGTGGPGDGPGGAGGPLAVQHVHPTPGMDEKQVGDYAAARLMFALEQSGQAAS